MVAALRVETVGTVTSFENVNVSSARLKVIPAPAAKLMVFEAPTAGLIVIVGVADPAVAVVTDDAAKSARVFIVPSEAIIKTSVSVPVVRLPGPEPICKASTFTFVVDRESAESAPVPSSITFKEVVRAAESVVLSKP